MINYIVRRLLILPFTLIGLTMLIYAMFAMLSPYERAALYVADVPKGPGSLDEIVEKYGLNDPIHIQYLNWLVGRKDPDSGEIFGGVLRGDLGWSHAGKSPVAEVIGRRFPATVELALWSSAAMILPAVWMGIKSAVNHNKFIDQLLRALAIAAWSLPAFVLGLLLLMLFYSDLKWFPPGRLSLEMAAAVLSDEFVQYTRIHTIDSLLNLRFDIFLDAIRHLVLPVFTLSIVNWAFLLRVTRSSMLETLRQDYITTARSKGMPEKRVVNKHAVPNAMIPVITVGGLTLVSLFNGVVITETVFNFPGLGSMFVDSALDAVSLLGLTLVVCIVMIAGNLLIDILYIIVDPRIRLK